MTKLPVTRFAPSPTGGLHLGGARTAIFNWLFARHYGGKFLLRIEDTDQKRSTTQFIEDILQAMRWLKIDDYNEPVYYQSEHSATHVQVAESMLANGSAYRCYCTHEELETQREKDAQAGRPPRYNGKCRNLSTKLSLPYTIRLKTPLDQEIKIHDMVQGTVVWQSKDLDDLVLVRSDGSPTYMLSVVVDDHNMGVTHVIRGSDHLSNTPKQYLIYQAMQWKIPQFGHVPLIHAADNTKLSKRHGAVSVQEYQAQGFLADALFNYLLRLGWSYGDEEIISRDQAVQWFDPKNLGRSAAKFDMVKLLGVNKHYIQKLTTEEVMAGIEPFWRQLYRAPWNATEAKRLTQLMPELQIRSNTLLALTEACGVLRTMNKVDSFSDKACELLQNNPQLLRAVHDKFSEVGNEDWQQDNLRIALENLTQEKGLNKSTLAQTIRAALTGSHVSPSIYDVLFCLGRNESLCRISNLMH